MWTQCDAATEDTVVTHDDVIKWKQFPRYWPFVWGIHRSPVNSPHKGQWREALMFSLTCAWINGWVKNREAGDFRRHLTHCDVIVMHYNMTVWILARNDINFSTASSLIRLHVHRPQKGLGHLLLCGLHGNHQIWNAIFRQPNVVAWWKFARVYPIRSSNKKTCLKRNRYNIHIFIA